MEDTFEITPDMNLGIQSPGENMMEEAVEEKAVSKSQQRFFGMVDAYKKGDLSSKDISKSVKDAAKGMSMKQVKDFAKTKHKGLPNHINEKQLRKIIRETLEEVYSTQEQLNEVSDDTVDSAYMKALYDTNRYPYDDPMAVRRRAQVANIRNMRDERLGFNPTEMSGIMRTKGTSGNPSIDRRWATWQKNHVDRVNGRRTYNNKTGRWQTNNELQESVHNAVIDAMGKYINGDIKSQQANKAIMDLADSSNKINETSETHKDNYRLYADTYKSKNSDFMADLEEQISKGNVKNALKYVPEEALVNDDKSISKDKIKGDIALDKEGYLFVKRKNSPYDYLIYKKINNINENKLRKIIREALINTKK